MKAIVISMLIALACAAGFAQSTGDVNGSGSVDIVDALLVAQFYVGLNPANFNQAVSDVNCDGSTSIVDGLLIAQYYVGLIQSFSGCTPAPTQTPVAAATPTPVTGTEDLYAINWSSLSGSIGVHDPVIIKQGSTWYVFHTANGIAIKSSTNGTAWTSRGTVFGSSPAWHKTMIPETDGNIWAPDISFVNGTYYLYYAVSSFGSSNSVIGLATNTTLNPSDSAYKWVDKGDVIRSTSSSDYNCIDPNLALDASGVPWLAFGSFWSGIKIVKLDPSTMKPASGYQLYSIAYNNEIEAPFIVKRGSYFYQFVSFGLCCKGVNSTYNIRVGRSTSINGTYTDKNGTSMMNRGGTLIDQSDSRWIGPGHNAVYSSGDTWILVNHAYDAQNNGYATLRIKPLYWDSQGWPYLQ